MGATMTFLYFVCYVIPYGLAGFFLFALVAYLVVNFGNDDVTDWKYADRYKEEWQPVRHVSHEMPANDHLPHIVQEQSTAHTQFWQDARALAVSRKQRR